MEATNKIDLDYLKLDENEMWLKGLMFRALDFNDQQFSIIYSQEGIKTGRFNFVKIIMALANDTVIDFT